MINSFLLIGQSNMAGRGKLEEAAPIHNEDILMFRDHTWTAAREPVHTDKPEIAGIGLCMSFADELQRKYQKQIGLVPCAFGGTALSEWQKGEVLYENAVASIKEALKDSKLKGILWHQGEGDSGDLRLASSYKERFYRMINAMTADIECDPVPVIVGELGEYLKRNNTQIYFEAVNSNLKEMVQEQNNYGFVPSTGLVDGGDILHFNSISLREFGLRYAKVWEDTVYRMGIQLE